MTAKDPLLVVFVRKFPLRSQELCTERRTYREGEYFQRKQSSTTATSTVVQEGRDQWALEEEELGKLRTALVALLSTLVMLPSARRAELSRQYRYFDNSYLSRKAFEVDAIGNPVGTGAVGGGEAPYHHNPHRAGRSHSGKEGSFLSRTTVGLTTFDEDLPDEGLDDFEGDRPRNFGRVNDEYVGSRGQHADYHRHPRPHDSSDEAEVSDYSDEESLPGSLRSGDSYPSTVKSYETGIRYSSSPAAYIWQILQRMDEVVLEVKANVRQCQRLNARLAALKKPMVAVHKGRQTADHAVLATIKDLVTEAHQFMQRFLDSEWWRTGAGLKEDSETFRELTFRLGFLMQAPAGFQEQSQEEDHVDRLSDYADLQASLEDKLRTTKDSSTGRDIVEALRRVRERAASEGEESSPEIDMRMVQYDKHETTLGDGGFGTVYAATLGGARVVVKKLNNQNVRPHLLEGMRKELEMYQQLQFDFVVKTFGGCIARPNVCVVLERASHSLFDLLHHREDFSSPCPAPSEALSSREKAAMLYDVARGLQFLHIKAIVHGNLKSTNVLVFENNRLKVSDFGMTAVRESQSIMGGGDTVPSAAWTAPEVLDDKDASVLSDVYSFGVLIHEVLTQRIPFAGKSVAKVITAVVAKCHRPAYLENEEETMPAGLVKLADVCWTQDPAARTTNLNTVVTELGHIVNALGGDPRPQPNHEMAEEEEAACSQGKGATTNGERMTPDERRIQELEEELRALKMRQQAGGGVALVKKEVPASEDDCSDGGYDGGPVIGIPEERSALRALYTATQGPAWHKQRGWETNDPDLSTWYGVVCGKGGHVTTLQLKSNNLHGQLPRELECLTHLTRVDMSDNLLEGPIPVEFGKFVKLVELDLSMNDLTKCIPSELANAESLERLYLQCNGFDGSVPRSFLKLENLAELNVDWRSLFDTHPFRNFRKASPPITDTEIERSKAESRIAAIKRAAVLGGPAVPDLSNQQQQDHLQRSQSHAGSGTRLQLQQEFSPSPGVHPIFTAAPAGGSAGSGSNGCGGGGINGGNGRAAGVGKYLTPRSSASGSPSTGAVTPFRTRLLRRKGGGGGVTEGMRSPSSSEHSSTAALARSSATVTRNGSGQFSDSSVSYTAPTAPYKGEDGLVGKAKAAARAAAKSKAAPKSSGVKSAWKFFKDVVAIDMHPGYTDDTVTRIKHKTQPRPS